MLHQEESEQVTRCCYCGEIIAYGRVDRRFCSLSCKNRYHNRMRSPGKDKDVQRIMRILYKNRDVLSKLLKMGIQSIDRITLVHLGFNLNYFTSLQRVRHRWVYGCLDIRYELTPTRVKNISFLWEGADKAC